MLLFVATPALPVQRQAAPTRRRVSCCALTRREAGAATLAVLFGMLPTRSAYAARPEGVNRPELLPTDFTTVIDLENFLASGEEKRLRQQIADLESRTGFKVRVLTQRFPQTPGAAVARYWNIDDRSVLLVADYFGGNQLLKFNVGAEVDKVLPPRFWSLLASNLGNKFYVEKNGESAAITTAVDNIRACLLGNGCNTPPYLGDKI